MMSMAIPDSPTVPLPWAQHPFEAAKITSRSLLPSCGNCETTHDCTGQPNHAAWLLAAQEK
jgi:hypothetical protein